MTHEMKTNDNNEAKRLEAEIQNAIGNSYRDFYDENGEFMTVLDEGMLMDNFIQLHRTEMIREMEEERRRLKQILTTKDNYFDFGDAVNNYIMDLGQRISELKGERDAI